jgi:hypothetical protein
MSAEIVDLGHHRLKRQLSLSVALLSAAAGVPINLDEALKQPSPESDRDFIGRLVQAALDLVDQGELLAAADRLNSAASTIKRIAEAPRKRVERNRKRRENRLRGRQSRSAPGAAT